jgi:hypothetical protein
MVTLPTNPILQISWGFIKNVEVVYLKYTIFGLGKVIFKEMSRRLLQRQ